MKCRSAKHLDGRSRMMREYEGWRMIRWIVTPPAFPMVVRPLAANRPEHVATEDEGTETFHRASGESVIRASVAILFSLHLTKSPRWEKPLKDFLASHAKRVVQTLSGSCSKAIKRDTEPG